MLLLLLLRLPLLWNLPSQKLEQKVTFCCAWLPGLDLSQVSSPELRGVITYHSCKAGNSAIENYAKCIFHSSRLGKTWHTWKHKQTRWTCGHFLLAWHALSTHVAMLFCWLKVISVYLWVFHNLAPSRNLFVGRWKDDSKPPPPWSCQEMLTPTFTHGILCSVSGFGHPGCVVHVAFMDVKFGSKALLDGFYNMCKENACKPCMVPDVFIEPCMPIMCEHNIFYPIPPRVRLTSPLFCQN